VIHLQDLLPGLKLKINSKDRISFPGSLLP
jgi:hypothetical protein